jgi:hypothetical protein
MRTYTASSNVDWIISTRSYPGEPRFTNIRTLVKVFSRVEYGDRCTFETRFYISSAPLDIDRLADAARGHRGVESMHWLLDVEFKDDLSRYRIGHGAKNMAIVRRFALARPEGSRWSAIASSRVRGVGRGLGATANPFVSRFVSVEIARLESNAFLHRHKPGKPLDGEMEQAIHVRQTS